MPDYKEMYFELFNKITDVIEELKEIQRKWKKNVLVPIMMSKKSAITRTFLLC